MEGLHKLVFSELGIPAWQMVLHIGLISLFMLTHRTKFCLITSYLFTLFWIFYFFRAYLVSVASGDFLALTAYILFGFALAGLALYAFVFFKEIDRNPGFLGLEINRLQKTLLKRIDRMELAVLEAETKAVNEVKDLEDLNQKVEARVVPLESHLHEMEEALEWRESAIKGLEENLTARILDLEGQLREKEGLSQMRHREAEDLRSEAEEKVVMLQALLQEQEGSFGRRSASFKEVVETLTARIHDLEDQLKEGPLQGSDGEIRKKQGKRSRPNRKAGEQTKESLEAELEKIRAGLREGEVPPTARKIEQKMAS